MKWRTSSALLLELLVSLALGAEVSGSPDLSGLEVPDEAIERHLIVEQRLVAWLPERYQVGERGPGMQEFTEPGQAVAVRFVRQELSPGLGLQHLVELTNTTLTDQGMVRKILGLNRIEVAGQAAIEVVAETTVDGVERTSRLVTTIDPDKEHYRHVILHCDPAREKECDAALAAVLRDLTPLERVSWDAEFELLRSRLDTVPGPLPRARCNAILAAAGEPAAIGQPWVAQQLAALGREAPILLLDGLLHHHPRVRRASLDQLAPLVASPELRDALLARALRDPDPGVRLRAALHAAADSEHAAAVLPAVLSIDETAARSGAYQLFALLDPVRRAELLGSLSAQRDQLPPASQELLVLACGDWGGEGAGAVLSRVWERAMDERLRGVAREELLRRGDAKALAAARRRLGDESAAVGLDLATAARHVAVNAPAGSEVGEWEQLSERLSGESAKDDPKSVAAADTFRELADYLRSLPDTASAENECLALRRMLLDGEAGEWVPERFARLAGSCAPAAGARPCLQVEVPRPGALLLAYAGLLDRLELASAQTNQMFHTLLSVASVGIEQEAGDPILSRAEMARATGIDFLSPWRWVGWVPSSPDGLAFAHESGMGLAFSWSLRCDHPDQLLELLMRASYGDLTPRDLVALTGLVSTALPFLPAGLVGVWEDQQKERKGEDEEAEPTPKEVHVAVVPQSSPDGALLYTIHRIALASSRPAERSVVFVRIDGHDVTLAQDRELLAPGADASQPNASETADSRTEVDLATWLRDRLDDSYGPPLLESLRLEAATQLGGDRIATTFELAGLPPAWLAAARPEEPGRLRSPASILPQDTLAWVVATFHPSALAERLREDLLGAELGPEVEGLADLVAVSDGEAGVAVVGLPEDGADPGAAWERRVVGFLAVPEKAADRYLEAAMPGSRVSGGMRVAKNGKLVATHREGFLQVASTPELLERLSTGPRLAAGSVFGRVAARTPPASAVFGGGDVDTLADAILRGMPADDEQGLTTLAVEFFRAFGPIAASVTLADNRVQGTVALQPNLMDEEAHARVRRLVGFPGYAAGSIPVEGFPADLADEADRVEVTLEVADEGWAFPEQWASRRLEVRRLAPTRYLLISRSAPALPETSTLTLPINGDAVAPYLRAESGLEIRADEVKALADEIRGADSDPARIVRQVMAWVGDNLSYRVVHDADGVSNTLETRQADCTEFTQLTVAICRALGIPARAVEGMVLGEDVAILHAWAEVYLDRWYEVDPTSGETEVPAVQLLLPDGNGFLLASTPGCRLVFGPATQEPVTGE